MGGLAGKRSRRWHRISSPITYEFDLARQDWGARGFNYVGGDSSNQVLTSRTLFSHPGIRGSHLLLSHDQAQGGNSTQLWSLGDRRVESSPAPSGTHRDGC
jgi:hypothetical protein